MKRAIFLLGCEFGYGRGEVEVEVLVEGTNGMSIIKLPPNPSSALGGMQSVTMADGSLVSPVCQDWLRDIQPPVHANLLKMR